MCNWIIYCPNFEHLAVIIWCQRFHETIITLTLLNSDDVHVMSVQQMSVGMMMELHESIRVVLVVVLVVDDIHDVHGGLVGGLEHEQHVGLPCELGI